MRLRLAGLIASAQRSISFGDARESPQITEFLARLAISLTAAKSPSEAIGKPASMTSTPMSSSSSATASFSSWVMVAPGHCSPSRKVVSKMTTRSFSDFAGTDLADSDLAGSDLAGVVMTLGLSRLRPPLPGQGARGFRWLQRSPECPGANAQPAPSGGAKQQEPAE